jgi:hypothetical protein
VDARANMGPSIGFLAVYAFVLLSLLFGGKHFRRERVE